MSCALPLKHDVSNYEEEFKTATRLFSRNVDVNGYNIKGLKALGKPIAPVTSVDNCAKARGADSKMTQGLYRRVHLAEGCRVMLTKNLWAKTGLVNGAQGTVREIIYPQGAMPDSMPVAAMVEFDNYSGPGFRSGDGPVIVPITPITTQWVNGKTSCTRTQLPLRLSYALTVHKSQGLALDKVVADVGDREMAAGLTFVAFSRVRKFTDLAIVGKPFTRYGRIGQGKQIKNRLAEQKRLARISRKTVAAMVRS